MCCLQYNAHIQQTTHWDTVMSKYEFVEDDVIEVNGHVLKRIRALETIFAVVKEGQLGGYIEHEGNLSHCGNCWVGKQAKVYGTAQVTDNAVVTDEAEVFENARVMDRALVLDSAKVYGNSSISHKARVYRNAEVSDFANVTGHAFVDQNAKVFGTATVCEFASVRGYAKVYNDSYVCDSVDVAGHANITETDDYVFFGNVGSENGILTVFRTEDDAAVTRGCFSGSVNEFLTEVKETHGDNEHAQLYRALIEAARIKLKF